MFKTVSIESHPHLCSSVGWVTKQHIPPPHLPAWCTSALPAVTQPVQQVTLLIHSLGRWKILSI